MSPPLDASASGDGTPGPGPHEMTAAELEDFRALWNECVVGGSAAELAAAHVIPSLDPDSPDTARLEIPARGDQGGEYRCLLTVSSRGKWRPLSLIKPGELDQALLNASARLEDINADVQLGESRLQVDKKIQALDAHIMAIADRLDRCNPGSGSPGWQSIPDSEPLLGFWSRVPASECRP